MSQPRWKGSQKRELAGKLSGDARGRAQAAWEKVAAGREGVAEMAACLATSPKLDSATVKQIVPMQDQEDLERYIDRLRQAGLPEG